MEHVSVHVLIPYYNDPDGLAATLESLDDPTGVSVLVVDDGSAVPAGDVIDGLQLPVPVRVLTLDENRGIEHALNAGLKSLFESEVPYIARLDCGDLARPGRFARQVARLNEAPDLIAVGSWVDWIDSGGELLYTLRPPVDRDAALRGMAYNPTIIHPAVMVRTSMWKEVGFYRTDRKGAEDYDLFWRMAKHHPVENIPEVLTACLISDSGLSVAGRKVQSRTRLRIMIDNFTPHPRNVAGLTRGLIVALLPRRATVRLRRVVERVASLRG